MISISKENHNVINFWKMIWFSNNVWHVYKKKNCFIYKMYRKNKTRTAKIHFQIDRSKEKKVEERRWQIYISFYKNSFNDLNNIKNLNSKYKSKRCQKRKKSFLSMKKKVRNKYRKKECWKDKSIVHFN